MYEKYPTADNHEFIEYLKDIGYKKAKDQLDHAMQWSGGIRGSQTYADCRAAGKSPTKCMPAGNGCDGGGGICIEGHEACEKGFVGKTPFVTQKARESCKFAFDHDLHWNRPVHFTVVECPASLTRMTGLQPADPSDIGNPSPVKSSTTTMEDCCEPTCSHESNVKSQWKKDVFKDDYNALYTCNMAGERRIQTEASPNPCEEGAAPSPPPATPPPTALQSGGNTNSGGLPLLEPAAGECIPNPRSHQHAAASQCAA